MGIAYDESSGDRFLVRLVARHAPATGKLLPGDVILRARDAMGTWEGFEQLRDGMWGFGVLGTPVTLTVQRGEQIQEITIQRGLVQEFDSTMAEFSDSWLRWMARETPDLHMRDQLSSSPRVIRWRTMLRIPQRMPCIKPLPCGASATSCAWMAGKIVEWWGVEDALSMYRQFGYRLVEPGKDVIIRSI